MKSRRTAAKKPRAAGGVMRARAWDAFSSAVEDGVGCGWRRAHKHTDTPDAESIQAAIYDAVTASVAEAFDFDPQEER